MEKFKRGEYLCKALHGCELKGCLQREGTFLGQSDPLDLCNVKFSFATRTYMHSMGSAQNVSKTTVCFTIFLVVHALTLNVYEVFPGHLPTHIPTEAFYKISGIIHQ